MPKWVEIYQSGIGAIIGLFGLAVVTWINYGINRSLERRRVNHERAMVARALRGEIRNSQEVLRARIEAMDTVSSPDQEIVRGSFDTESSRQDEGYEETIPGDRHLDRPLTPYADRKDFWFTHAPVYQASEEEKGIVEPTHNRVSGVSLPRSPQHPACGSALGVSSQDDLHQMRRCSFTFTRLARGCP